jgi:hypothetical protein
LSAGIWYCVECLREAGPEALKANLWPNECGESWESGLPRARVHDRLPPPRVAPPRFELQLR